MLFKAWADIRTFLNIDISINFFRPVVTFDNQKQCSMLPARRRKGFLLRISGPAKCLKRLPCFICRLWYSIFKVRTCEQHSQSFAPCFMLLSLNFFKLRKTPVFPGRQRLWNGLTPFFVSYRKW